MTKGRIHSTESFGSVDGPGIRFIIFLQGCAMRCKYCHNPDTWNTAGGFEATADELLDKAERYRDYWGAEGGITVSGGEPLLQIDFVTELFTKAHERGINTCIDTCGQPFRNTPEYMLKFDALMKVTDLVMLDLKVIDSSKHLLLTGHRNENIRACFVHLDQLHQPIWVRHVLVPGWTDDDNLLTRLRHFIDTLHNIKRVEVLPYHAMAIHKWDALGIPYTLRDTEPPTRERVENAEEILGTMRFS